MKKFFFAFFLSLHALTISAVPNALDLNFTQAQLQKLIDSYGEKLIPKVENFALPPFEFRLQGHDVTVVESYVSLDLMKPQIELTPVGIRVAFSSKNLAVNISDMLLEKNLYVTTLRSHCFDTTINTSDENLEIPLTVELRPTLKKQKIHLSTSAYQFPLDAVDLDFTGPSSCSTPIIRSLMKKIVAKILQHNVPFIKDIIYQQVEVVLKSINHELSKKTAMDLPIKDFFLHAYPTQLNWDQNQLKLTYGVDFLTQSPIKAVELATDSMVLGQFSLHQEVINSFLAFFTDTLKKSVDLELSEAMVPGLGQVLNRTIMREILPDLKDRELSSESLRAFLHLTQFPRIEILDNNLFNLHFEKPVTITLQIEEKGQWINYLDLNVTNDLQMELKNNLEEKKWELHLTDLSNVDLKTSWRLTPSDSSTNPEVLKQMMNMIYENYKNKGSIISLSRDALRYNNLSLQSLSLSTGLINFSVAL